MGLAARPGGRPGRFRPGDDRRRHGLPHLPRTRRRLVPRGRPAPPARPVPRRQPRRLGPDRAQLPPLHDRHRLADPPRGGLRHGHPARRRRGRLARLLRRRRHLPGRRERGLHLGVRLQRSGRVLLPEQPVGHLRAAGAADQDPALQAGQRLRLPRHPGRRQRRVRVPGGHPGGAAQRARGQRPDAGRGVHLPHGRPHHLRRPDALPGRRRAGGVEAQRPDRAGQGLPVPQPARRPGVLRQDRGRGRPARQGPAGPLPGPPRPAARRDVRPRLRRAPRAHRRGTRAVHHVHERLRGAQ